MLCSQTSWFFQRPAGLYYSIRQTTSSLSRSNSSSLDSSNTSTSHTNAYPLFVLFSVWDFKGVWAVDMSVILGYTLLSKPEYPIFKWVYYHCKSVTPSDTQLIFHFNTTENCKTREDKHYSTTGASQQLEYMAGERTCISADRVMGVHCEEVNSICLLTQVKIGQDIQ